jgi:hypothetical protein
MRVKEECVCIYTELLTPPQKKQSDEADAVKLAGDEKKAQENLKKWYTGFRV